MFDVDETASYWKMPSGTFTVKREKSVPGFEALKERLILLVGAM